MTPSLLELCDHARRSCMVNGLIPKEWRWGRDIAKLYADLVHQQMVNGEIEVSFEVFSLPKRFQGLPVSRMDAQGVACIGKKPYISLLNKTETL